MYCLRQNRKLNLLSLSKVEHIIGHLLELFRSCLPSHGGDHQTSIVMNPAQPIGTIDSVAFLLVAISYQGYPDSNHKL